MVNRLIEELQAEGYTQVKHDMTEIGAHYFTAIYDGKQYEIQARNSEWDEGIEINRRLAGNEDWNYLFDI